MSIYTTESGGDRHLNTREFVKNFLNYINTEGVDMALDQDKLQHFLQKALDEIGATFHANLVVIGDQLGLYKAMAGAGPLTSVELAERTNTAERYVREWLAAQAASGYVTYEPTTGRFLLSEEQAFALANDDSPAFLPGAFQLATSAIKIAPRLLEAFRTGAGVGWHEHDPGLFQGTERFPPWLRSSPRERMGPRA